MAVIGGHIKIVQLLLIKGADIEAKTKEERTSLHIASVSGNFYLCKILVMNKANINA